MTPHKQLYLHDPENGVYGDCGRTVIACLLDMDPVLVPHFWDGAEEAPVHANPEKACDDWLKDRGILRLRFTLSGDMPIGNIHDMMAAQHPGIHYILQGRSKNGTDHVVICLNDKIVHDPAIDASGIVGPCYGNWWGVEFLFREIGGMQEPDGAAL